MNREVLKALGLSDEQVNGVMKEFGKALAEALGKMEATRKIEK